MIEAVVQTGLFETAYRRAGSGSPVLLLLDHGPAWDWMFEQLSRRFRTIAPLLPSELRRGEWQETFELWLRGLIDGLGLQRPALVAGATDGAALLRFAALDPHRVGRVALLEHAGSGESAAARGPLAERDSVLWIRIPGAGNPASRAVALARLLDFLATAPDQAVAGSFSVS